MALLAFLAQASFMHVISFVASIALGACFSIFLRGLVTGTACNGTMLAFKGKIGPAVIESLFVQFYNVHVSTLMVGMTDFALDVGDIADPSVISRLLINILVYFLVTFSA